MKIHWGRGLPIFIFLFSSMAWGQGVVFLRKGYVQVNGRAVEAGDPFRSASQAVTDEGSLLRVVYADSSFVHAGPNTRLSVVADSEKAFVNLESGWVWVRAGSDRLISVSSGDAKVEGQGADFIFRAAGSPRVLVLEGSVRLHDGTQVQTLDGRDLESYQLPFLSELTTGEGAAIAIERRFLLGVMERLKSARGGEVTQGSMKDGRAHGRIEVWSGEVGLKERVHYEQGVRNGVYESYFGDRRPRELGRFERGNRTGLWSTYYENGKLADEGEYQNGRRVGVWKFYSLNGKLVRIWNFDTQGDWPVPRWQWGLAYLGAAQRQGDFHTGAAMITRCLWCDLLIAPRIDITMTWLKFQEESTGAAFGAHAGVDVVLGPVILRGWYGAEYLVKDPVRTSIGLELTRTVGRDFHSRDWQPFVRVSQVEMGARSDITFVHVGLWESF